MTHPYAGPLGLFMSDADIPDKLGPALRWAIAGIALFVFFLIAAEKFADGKNDVGVVFTVLFIATFLVAVKWKLMAQVLVAAAKWKWRRAMGVGFIVVGVLCIAIGTYVLAYQREGSRFTDGGRTLAEEQLKKERVEKETAQSRATNTQAALADMTRQRDEALRAAKMPPPPPPPEDQIPVNWQTEFQLNYEAGPKFIWIRFVGQATALAKIKDAYILSSLTGRTSKLQVVDLSNQAVAWSIEEIEPIPSGATVILICRFQPSLPPSDFQSQWGAFQFHVVYDNKTFVKTYSQEYVSEKLIQYLPGVLGPRVTPKKISDK